MKLKTVQTIQAVLLALTVIVYLFGRLSDSTPLYITCLVLLGIETVIWLIWGAVSALPLAHLAAARRLLPNVRQKSL